MNVKKWIGGAVEELEHAGFEITEVCVPFLDVVLLFEHAVPEMVDHKKLRVDIVHVRIRNTFHFKRLEHRVEKLPVVDHSLA